MKNKILSILLVLFLFITIHVAGQEATFRALGDAIKDFKLKVAAGRMAGIKSINKYGHASDVDAHNTDIWSGAVTGDAGDLWVAPTQARIHDLVSGSALDTCGINTLTLTGQILDTETITIGTKVYTFQNFLTDVDGNVKIDITLGTGTLTLTGIVSDTETVTIEGTAYTFQDTLTDVDGNVLIVYTKAAGVLTLTGQPLNTETVTIEGVVYTFQTTLTDVDGNVLIGADEDESLNNLINAIGLTGTPGTDYALSMTINTDFTAVAGAGTTMDLTSIIYGTGANALTTVETLTNGAFGAVTLEGATTSASGTIDNLIAGINLAAGAGTTYATSMTTAAESFDAAAGAGDTMSLYDLDSEGIATTQAITNGTWNAATVTPGTGARKITIYGLKTWATKESSEVISLKGAVATPTLNSYVIIHRMIVTGMGATVNAGLITATAKTDSTVTAIITVMSGQTEMAIYGVPTTQTFFLTQYYASLIKGANTVHSSVVLLVNPVASQVTTPFIIKHDNTVSGGTHFHHKFDFPVKISGGCIIKIRGNATTTNVVMDAGFDGYIIDN